MFILEGEAGICPFTLELCADCGKSLTIDTRNLCPFTLEACSIEQGRAAVKKIRARDTHRFADLSGIQAMRQVSGY